MRGLFGGDALLLGRDTRLLTRSSFGLRLALGFLERGCLCLLGGSFFLRLLGGKFLLLIIEAIRRKPIPKKYEGIITMVGAVLIMLLAVVVLVNDVIKLF